jgi:hypothetical protein
MRCSVPVLRHAHMSATSWAPVFIEQGITVVPDPPRLCSDTLPSSPALFRHPPFERSSAHYARLAARPAIRPAHTFVSNCAASPIPLSRTCTATPHPTHSAHEPPCLSSHPHTTISVQPVLKNGNTGPGPRVECPPSQGPLRPTPRGRDGAAYPEGPIARA